MSVNSQSRKNTVYYINSLITLILIFGFGFLPPIAPITPVGMRILGILLGLLYGWTLVGFGPASLVRWPSVCPAQCPSRLSSPLAGAVTSRC